MIISIQPGGNTVQTGVREVPVMQIFMDSNAGIGWVVNLLLFLMLGYVIFILAERYYSLKTIELNENVFSKKLSALLENGTKQQITELCTSSKTYSARILEKGLKQPTYESAKEIMENEGKAQVMNLERRVSFLATAAGAGPMLGFFGTVVGMVVVFIDLESAKSLDVKVLAPGMMTAMITTVEGLIVGIIAYMGHNSIQTSIEKIIMKFESRAVEMSVYLMNNH